MKMNRTAILVLGIIVMLIIALLVTQRNEQAVTPEPFPTTATQTPPDTSSTPPAATQATPAPFNNLPAASPSQNNETDLEEGAGPAQTTEGQEGAPEDENTEEELPNGAAQPAETGAENDMNAIPATEGAETAPAEQPKHQ